jgi:alpha-amylase/alpha-mannosidase (GH57 family)
MKRFICIHCHFYQPPRENPWLEAIEVQDSASPYHDWNERISAQCYLPNGASRILDGQGRIARISNNYARISFNFGPTLLSWMEKNSPRPYERILEADRQSRELFSGHGAALAQAYNHIILPLASPRDKYTQVVWGIRDFQHRFGRDPEGMWLPETAVDLQTLEILSFLGIKFTILAPYQARGVRRHPWEEWISVEGGCIDPTQAYACHLPSGRTISLFFYDGPISRAVAFENLLASGEQFALRLLSGFSDRRSWPQLMHIATDGETYGHHHYRGDMALAFALDYLERNELACLTNYGEYLATYPPTQEAAILENTSWSCAHGIERWRSDCGCNSGGQINWHQQWRRPLRDALDWLRDELGAAFEFRAQELLRNPWVARDDYIGLVLDRSASNVDTFLARHRARDLSTEEQVIALKLLEMQRHLMLMYTSCGWFFDELTGLETVQILQYAGRAVQLAREVFGEIFGADWEEKFLGRLEAAYSNIRGFGNGRQVYERFVRPARLDLLGVAAHYAISGLFSGYRRTSLYCYDVELQESHLCESGDTKLALGRARVRSTLTREHLLVNFVVLHCGDHLLTAGVRPFQKNIFRGFAEESRQAFERGDLTECLRLIDRHFPGSTHSLKSLFRDEQRHVIGQIVKCTMGEAEAIYRQIYQHHASLMSFLSDVQVPLPPALRVTAEFVLGGALRQLLLQPETDLSRIQSLLETAARINVKLDGNSVELAWRQRLNALVDQWAKKPADLQLLEEIDALVSLGRVLPLEMDLWNSQNVYCELLTAVAGKTVSHASPSPWLDHFLLLGERLGIAVPTVALTSPGVLGNFASNSAGTRAALSR